MSEPLFDRKALFFGPISRPVSSEYLRQHGLSSEQLWRRSCLVLARWVGRLLLLRRTGDFRNCRNGKLRRLSQPKNAAKREPLQASRRHPAILRYFSEL